MMDVKFVKGRLTLKNSVEPSTTSTMQGFLHGQNLLLRIAAAMRWEVEFHAGVSHYSVEIVPRRDC